LLVQKILLDPKMQKTWISNRAKDIGEYDTEELIAFSTFLARYLIEDYQDLDAMAERVLSGFSPSSLSGKCSDYTGMSIHILNNYFKLKYPEKFRNITIGYDSHNIGNGYNHCYMKIYGYGRDGGVDVTFIDPTKLAGVSMDQLGISKDVFDAMDTSDFPIQIDRNAEDLIAAKLRGSASEPDKLDRTSVRLLSHAFVEGFKS
jgi:hypothetical protein